MMYLSNYSGHSAWYDKSLKMSCIFGKVANDNPYTILNDPQSMCEKA